MIALVDLKAQMAPLRPQIEGVLAQMVEECIFVKGPRLQAFEEAFAAYCGVGFAVGTSSGTTAIHLALTALGIGPGDEVILPSHTFIGTAEPVVITGAKIIFAEVRPDTYLMDVAAVARLITPATRAIIPVHLYGQMVDMTQLTALVAQADHKIFIIEDAAQAHGAEHQGRRPGSWGDVACYSFFPAKNLGAMGDGGACVCQDPALAQRLRKLADHGRTDKYHHDIIGFNYRLDPLQAAILHIKLPHLDGWNASRRAYAALYHQWLSPRPEVTIPAGTIANNPVFHLYVIQCDHRQALQDHLRQEGIETGIHYPIPLHQQPALARYAPPPGTLPVTEKIVQRILSLPLYPEMGETRVVQVAQAVLNFYRSREGRC